MQAIKHIKDTFNEYKSDEINYLLKSQESYLSDGGQIKYQNMLLDANYMYLCQKPIVDNPLVIGEWPYYIIFIELIALINFWLLYQPIKLFKK